jgi:hypothetical protein
MSTATAHPTRHDAGARQVGGHMTSHAQRVGPGRGKNPSRHAKDAARHAKNAARRGGRAERRSLRHGTPARRPATDGHAARSPRRSPLAAATRSPAAKRPPAAIRTASAHSAASASAVSVVELRTPPAASTARHLGVVASPAPAPRRHGARAVSAPAAIAAHDMHYLANQFEQAPLTGQLAIALVALVALAMIVAAPWWGRRPRPAARTN